MPALEQLLVVQEHDANVDRLRHQRETLPERAGLAKAAAELAATQPALDDAQARRSALARDVKRLEDETGSLSARETDLDRTMYSGTISSPKELQAMQEEIDQLKRVRTGLEDRELELMESLESVDGELARLTEERSGTLAEVQRLQQELAEREAEIDAEIGREQDARAAAAGPLPAELVSLYETCRVRAGGTGVARLVGATCQGCRLSIPATEVDRIKHAGPDGPVFHCDNCGAILVAS
jgi:predicted  nucleic acid-binding Zn-ribbon protein